MPVRHGNRLCGILRTSWASVAAGPRWRRWRCVVLAKEALPRCRGSLLSGCQGHSDTQSTDPCKPPAPAPTPPTHPHSHPSPKSPDYILQRDAHRASTSRAQCNLLFRHHYLDLYRLNVRKEGVENEKLLQLHTKPFLKPLGRFC